MSLACYSNYVVYTLIVGLKFKTKKMPINNNQNGVRLLFTFLLLLVDEI